MWGQFLGNGFHEHHDTAFGGSIIHMSGPWESRHVQNSSIQSSRLKARYVTVQQLPFPVRRTARLPPDNMRNMACKIHIDHFLPLLQSHFQKWRIFLQPRIADEHVKSAKFIEPVSLKSASTSSSWLTSA
jgi:hypothetical protein